MNRSMYRLLVFVALGLMMATELISVPLIPDSAFKPQVCSRLAQSYLLGSESFIDPKLPADSLGLKPPFGGPSSFVAAIKNALSPKPEASSLFSYRYRDEDLDFRAKFQFLAGYEHNFAEAADVGFLYRGWRLHSNINERIYLNAGWWGGDFFGDQDLANQNPLVDTWHSQHAGNLNLDNATGDISYRDKHHSLALGRGRLTIGDNISGSIVLNTQVNDYAYLLAEGIWGDFRVSLLHASLVADSTYEAGDNANLNSKNYPDKYMALHQISYLPGDRLELYAGETVVYGNRGIDVNYLIPAAFWRAIEHNLQDRDNVLIYAGAAYDLSRTQRFYLQAAVDEFSYSKVFSNWWGNKYAVKLGSRSLFPCRWVPSQSLQLGLELTAIRPWTYTHYLNHNMYSHDGRPLGYHKGSNILDLTAELHLPIVSGLRLDTAFSYIRQGAFGSYWRQNYLDEYAGNQTEGTADWFEGASLDRWTLFSALSTDILAHHKLMTGLKLTDQGSNSLWLAWQFLY